MGQQILFSGCLRIWQSSKVRQTQSDCRSVHLQGHAVALDLHTDAWLGVPPTGAQGMRLCESSQSTRKSEALEASEILHRLEQARSAAVRLGTLPWTQRCMHSCPPNLRSNRLIERSVPSSRMLDMPMWGRRIELHLGHDFLYLGSGARPPGSTQDRSTVKAPWRCTPAAWSKVHARIPVPHAADTAEVQLHRSGSVKSSGRGAGAGGGAAGAGAGAGVGAGEITSKKERL